MRGLGPFAHSRPFSGSAGYYGQHLQGHRMANGRRYNRHALTAATRRLRLNSHARLTSLRTHMAVRVTVTSNNVHETSLQLFARAGLKKSLEHFAERRV